MTAVTITAVMISVSTSSAKRTEPRLWRFSTSRLSVRCWAVRRSEARRWRSSDISLTKARSQSARLWRIFMALTRGRLGAGRRLGALVNGHEAEVVLGDLARPGGALDLPVHVGLQRVPPDGAPDGEADISVNRRGGVQPRIDLGVVGATAEHHAGDALTAARTCLGDQHLAVGALVHALDLPDVGLDARVLDLGDRAAHQLGAQLGVIAVVVPADRLELGVLGGHQQLEQELAVVLLEPVAEPLELAELLGVGGGVAVGVVANEHLGEVGVEAQDVLAEVLAVLEVERALAGALGGHGQLEALLARLGGHGGAELLVHEHPRGGSVGARADGLQQPLVDEVLGVGDDRRLLGVRLTLDPEELLLEGAAVVEGEDVELLVVSEVHCSEYSRGGRSVVPRSCLLYTSPSPRDGLLYR